MGDRKKYGHFYRPKPPMRHYLHWFVQSFLLRESSDVGKIWVERKNQQFDHI